MRFEQCLVKRCSLQSECSQEMIKLGEGTDPNIAVLCSNHLDYAGSIDNYWKKQIQEMAEAAEYRGRIVDNTLYRIVDRIKEQCQESKDKKLWFELFEDLEAQIKEKLKQWIEKINQRKK